MAKVALLIGVSEYEFGLSSLSGTIKDVKAMQQVLYHPEMGGFAPDDVKVLENPERQEMEEAIEALFFNRQKDDLVLLYFSGHGIKDDSGKLFLATRQTRKNLKGELVKTTAVAASLVHDVMEHSNSRLQVIVLDCCFSGAFAEGMKAKDDGCLDIQKQLVDTEKPQNVEGRVVLTSSTATQYSFEQQDSDLSVYTRYLVEGIEKGAADTDNDGIISVDELHEYARKKVQEVAPAMKPGIFAVREGYKIQLAKVPNITQQQKSQLIINKIDLGEVKLGTARQQRNINHLHPQTSYLHNFLEPYESFLSELIVLLKNDNVINLAKINLNPKSEMKNRILEIIRRNSEADFVFVLHNDSQDNWFVESQSDWVDDIERDDYIDNLKSKVLTNIWIDSVFNRGYHGIYQIHESRKGISNAFVIIPLTSLPKAEVMIVCGIRRDSYLLGDVYSRILSSFYKASERLLEPALVEAAIIDDLKRDFGFVSASLYERRFELFCERLKRMVVYFEPILCLNAENLYISGWEALARNPDNWAAPLDLFKAAELWGPQFTIELDQHFLTVAIESYRNAYNEAKIEDMKPLSVNVYPESLMERAYFETVSEIINVYPFIKRHLILEISEKTEFTKLQDNRRSEFPIKSFKQKLMEYVRKFKIRFAIDDFGVGYASVSRLAGLNPPYVKIDREILYHEPNEVILKFVHELVEAYEDLKQSNVDVIVEGVDEKTPISLYKLKQIGVSYIQGHIVGKAGPGIYRLSKEKVEFLRKKLLEPTT